MPTLALSLIAFALLVPATGHADERTASSGQKAAEEVCLKRAQRDDDTRVRLSRTLRNDGGYFVTLRSQQFDYQCIIRGRKITAMNRNPL